MPGDADDADRAKFEAEGRALHAAKIIAAAKARGFIDPQHTARWIVSEVLKSRNTWADIEDVIAELLRREK